MKPPVRLLLSLAAALLVSPSLAADAIGKVDRVQGESQGIVEGATQNLAADAPVFLNEAVSTGPDARVALTFQDGTTLTLGEKAKVSLDDFVYEPNGANRLRMSVAGAFRYISGKLAPGATRDAMVTTPSAVIGVRGTDFWGGSIDGRFGVVVLEGAVTVTIPGGNSFDIDSVNVGVDIGGGSANVEAWTDDKRTRALATVSFR